MSQSLPQIEAALRELTKLLKAVQYYPSGHPAVATTASETRTAFLPLLEAGRNLTLRVHKEGFFLDETPVAAGNQVLRKLAAYLFGRLVQTLVILPDLSTDDLIGFGRALAIDPREVHRHGGIKDLLLKARLTTIWVNETDLEQILAHKREIEITKDDDTGGSGEDFLQNLEIDVGERDLKTVIEELRREQDDSRFAVLLEELVPLARLCQNPRGRLRLLEALALLCQFAADRSARLPRREAALNALNQLTQPELIDFLIDFLCDREIADRHRELLLRILTFLRQRSLERLMERLAGEKVGACRKILSNALARQGSQAVPLLAAYLRDERWYVVRNAVNILGEIRDPAATRHLNPLLHHEDIRVCRETIRALTRIGGPGAARILLDIINDDDEEISRQAILSLGVIGDETAVPDLLKIVRKSDFFCKQLGRKKDAIRALGEIGSLDALPALATVLKTRRIFKRHEQNELRAAAAQAIGEIGAPDSAPLLEQAASDRSPEVARQAATALKYLNRAHD
ncbi:HEAT repeat protein [Geothermobacter ehrlichii]|uniref:HEAT repeat protein n=1 Tax=Geothermobacter ehrlichii TaxID=213224 RepID=A0A5D3WGE6_9BACT|nr:HEAT repeat domain-containing protein [Geothermobacter ehrlichii]TYO97514.1 HEAT repeat protein [Geothermobacter ehrlichii]